MKCPLRGITPKIPDLTSPGCFGFKRSYYYHPGIDLYCPDQTAVVAIESGIVVNMENFTGPNANPPSPWWNETFSIMIEGANGVLGYCELVPEPYIDIGFSIKEGDIIGKITPVLKKDKGNGTTMLHFEKYRAGTKNHVTWHHNENKPESLEDPTELLHLVIS